MKMWFRRRKKVPVAAPIIRERAKPTAVIHSGRRFLEGSYLLPKDNTEISRLDFQHYLLRQALKGNYLAPIRDPGYMLDVGAGTGRWGKEMAQAFPTAHVMGIDLEQATSTGPIPPNYAFVPGSVLKRLPVADNTFHFVHQRLLVGAIPAKAWPDVIRELVRVTRPFGWIELVESGGETVNPGPHTEAFFQWGLEASLPHGIDPRVVPHLGKHLREQKLSPICTGQVDIPIGPWAGRLGTMMQEDLLSSFSALEALFTQTGPANKFHELLRQLPAEWESYHTFYRFFYFYGQK